MLEPRIDGYIHVQSVADTTWTIVHNMGTNAPIVDAWVDVSGSITKILPQNVTVTDVNTVVLTFSVARAGKAMVI